MDEFENSNNYFEEKKIVPKKQNGISRFILISIISAVIGGLITGGALLIVFNNMNPGLANSTSTNVKIVKTSSPVVEIAKKVSPSVVSIKATAVQNNGVFGTTTSEPQGSGIIVRSDGYIVTNYHVISDALGTDGKISSSSKIYIYISGDSEKGYEAKLIGGDSRTDLAVLKINKSGLTAAELGDSSTIEVGELVVAIGSPGGTELAGSVSQGIVSGLNRKIETEGGTEINLIQTDTAISPGNSGGALVNSQGQVIGINELKVVATGYEGIGFSIPINDAKTIINSLIKNGYIKRPYLGIYANSDYDKATADDNNLPEGILVDKVVPLSGAYNAGVEKGDIITKFNGVRVKTFDELNIQKDKTKAGQTVPVELYRDGKTVKVNITLTETKN